MFDALAPLAPAAFSASFMQVCCKNLLLRMKTFSVYRFQYPCSGFMRINKKLCSWFLVSVANYLYAVPPWMIPHRQRFPRVVGFFRRPHRHTGHAFLYSDSSGFCPLPRFHSLKSWVLTSLIAPFEQAMFFTSHLVSLMKTPFSSFWGTWHGPLNDFRRLNPTGLDAGGPHEPEFFFPPQTPVEHRACIWPAVSTHQTVFAMGNLGTLLWETFPWDTNR